MAILTFKLNENLFLRDPQNTDLGQKIISKSVELIKKLGFELFTFKKIAAEIDSTEASIYRYFENKHRLLLYLIDWYWTWLGYRLDFEVNNVADPQDRLRKCIRLLTHSHSAVPKPDMIEEANLRYIVIEEFEKVYLTKQVDSDNKEGLFLPYKAVCKKIATIVLEINPKYPFPHSLASTALLALTHQVYYAQHLPSLSDIKFDVKKNDDRLYDFLEGLLLNTLRK
jgi:AcrR family transcriptional regulator